MTAKSRVYYNEAKQWLTFEGMVVAHDLYDHELGPRKGHLAARFDDIANNTTLGIHVSETIDRNKGHRHVDEAIILMLTGKGRSLIYQAEERQERWVNWQPGSIFSPPINAFHQHFGEDESVRFRYLAIKNVPYLRRMFNSRDWIYDNSFRFSDRYNDEPDFWDRWEQVDEHLVRCSKVDDIRTVELAPWAEGGDGVSTMAFEMVGNQILLAHVTEIESGGNVRAHRHLKEEALFVLDGKGHTKVWQDDGSEVKLDWQSGDLFAVPLNAWHQHFNDGDEPARLYAVENIFVERLFRNSDFTNQASFAFSDRFDGSL